MRLFDDRRTTLRCFSPEVVLATFLLELLLAIYAWWRYRLTVFGRLSIAFLLLLAGFQLSEYAICRGAPSVLWSQIGYICTAWLPILGLDFIVRLRRLTFSMVWGYALAAAFSLVMALYPGLFGAATCTGQFVAFHTANPGFDVLYTVYYATTLFMGVGFAWQGWRAASSPYRRALLWILTGYLAFMVPALLIYAFVTLGKVAFASVLCGFAIVLAVILALKVLPLTHRR